jgi:hypothetical protein
MVGAVQQGQTDKTAAAIWCVYEAVNPDTTFSNVATRRA